jgi:type I site-specific restriction endonuclease
LFEGDTINYFDQFGIKIGKHFSFDEFNNPESVIYFGNGLRIWEADFDRKNKMKNITFFRDEKSLENISEKRLNRLMRKYERTFNRK